MPTNVDSTVLTNSEILVLADIRKDVEELLQNLRRLDRSQPDTRFITRCERVIELIVALNGTQLEQIEMWKEAVETQ